MGVKVRKITERWIKRENGTREKMELPEPYYAILVDYKGTRKFRKMKSKEEAEAKAKEIEEGLKNGTLSPPSPRPPKPVTFQEHAEKWYLARVMLELKYATQRSYREQLDRHILPTFGKKNLQDITRKEVKAFWSAKRREGLSVGTVRALNTILSAVFTDAIEEEHITFNPASKPGKHLKKEDDNKDYHTPEEGHAILEAAKISGPRMYPLFLAAWCTGARQGELIGLEWGDIDWRGKFITIRRTDYYGKVGTPKTGKIRRVDMADGLAAELEAHRRVMAAEALRKGRPLPERVFTTKKGTPHSANNIRRTYYRCLEKAGVRRINFHRGTRRGFASGHLNSAESLSYIGQQLGHSDIKMTASAYAFLAEGENRQAPNRLFSMLTDGKIRKHTQTAEGSIPKHL